MSQALSAPVTVAPNDWTDLCVDNAALANVQTWIQCNGPDAVRVAYDQTGTKPSSSSAGYLMRAGDPFGGNAAHIWVRALNVPTSVNAGAI